MNLTVILRLTLLCILLNLIRYYVIGFIEGVVVMGPFLQAMGESASYFRTEFQTMDWVTSYAYNFIMWFTAVVAFHMVRPQLTGSMMVRSLKVFVFFAVVFAAISAIYMNHYSHPKDFYVWSILDAALVFPLMGLANGWLYPLLVRESPGR